MTMFDKGAVAEAYCDVINDALDVVGESRFRARTNDIVLAAYVTNDGYEIRFEHRVDFLASVRKHFPEAPTLAEFVAEMQPPTRCPFVIFDERDAELNEGVMPCFWMNLKVEGTLDVLN